MRVSMKELCSCHPGKMAQVIEIIGGANVNRKLADLGIFPGSFVEILKNQGGPVLLAVGASRLAIGRGMAEKVIVRN